MATEQAAELLKKWLNESDQEKQHLAKMVAARTYVARHLFNALEYFDYGAAADAKKRWPWLAEDGEYE